MGFVRVHTRFNTDSRERKKNIFTLLEFNKLNTVNMKQVDVHRQDKNDFAAAEVKPSICQIFFFFFSFLPDAVY